MIKIIIETLCLVGATVGVGFLGLMIVLYIVITKEEKEEDNEQL